MFFCVLNFCCFYPYLRLDNFGTVEQQNVPSSTAVALLGLPVDRLNFGSNASTSRYKRKRCIVKGAFCDGLQNVFKMSEQAMRNASRNRVEAFYSCFYGRVERCIDKTNERAIPHTPTTNRS